MIALATHRQSTSLSISRAGAAVPTNAIASDLAAFALDCLEAAVFVLDRDMRVQFASAAARRLMEEGRLVVRNGQLGSPLDRETPALRRLIRQCVEVPTIAAGQMTFHRLGDDDNALCLAVVATRRMGGCEPFVMMFATRPCDPSLPQIHQLRSHFGLTQAQAKLAIEIARGEGLKASTQRLGIAITTGRSHLRRIFEKTDTRRQAELVRLISAFRLSAPQSGSTA
jgi:DNA-binding CsgD family transcriptional regulator